jgi:hypothetical protein
MNRILLRTCNLVLCLPVLFGCVSKEKAKRDAQAAYIAGQKEAVMRMQMESSQEPKVTVNGPVRNGIIPWTEDLTLAKAIVAAEYTPRGNPAEVFLVRSGRAFRIEIQDILSGRDIPLQPGDIIQLHVNPMRATTPQ